jgi:hypothetical protein
MASVEAPATLYAVPNSGKKSKNHPPKPYDIVQGMERVIYMMEETLQICETAQRSTQDASHRKTFPFGLQASSGVYTLQAAKLIQIQSGRQQPSADLKVEPCARRDPLDVPCIYHKGARHTLCGCQLRKKIARRRAHHTGSHVSGRRRVSEGPDPHHPQRPEIHPAARLGGLSERPTACRRDGFRGSTSDPSQREPRPEAGGGEVPGGTPMCPRPTPRVRRGGASDVQPPPGQPGRGVGTSPAG